MSLKCESCSRYELINGTRELAEVYPISAINIPDLRDAYNNIIIATGDRDLLVLQEYQNLPILTVMEFLERYFPEN